MKKTFSILLVLSVLFGFALGWTDALFAASEKAPISGTPMAEPMYSWSRTLRMQMCCPRSQQRNWSSGINGLVSQG